jgi:EAL domain-containing protein (putative c-di-GMP-specific phosphodiesterase class I)
MADAGEHGRPPRGGPNFLVELAARTLGYEVGVATTTTDGHDSVVASYGPSPETPEVAEAARMAADALAPVARPGLLAVPLLDDDGTATGTLVVAGPEGRSRADSPELLQAFADVLAEQLLLLRSTGSGPGVDLRVADLARAVREGEVVPWYQPVVDLASGRLVGFEALARWERPTGEVLYPAAFLDLAEQSDLIVEMDLAIVRQACAELARWQVDRPALRLGLNVSGRHLDDEQWDQALHAAVLAGGADPSTIDIELTETARPTDAHSGANALERLRRLGYAIWFDDFGTGWSELQDLVALPVDGVKIDRFFAEALGTRADAVVRAMTAAAAEIGIRTTIEGISTREMYERARHLGCQLAQGYLWSPAVPAARVDEILSETGDLPGVITAPAG